jgi:uncharacterized membrane protein YGL010W
MSKPNFHDYMRAYATDHTHPINRATHMIGIPLIVASLPVIPANLPVGLGMFAAGWAFQFAGHFFEGKKPSFTKDLRYLLVGPVWITVEWVEVLTGQKLYQPPEEKPVAESVPVAVGQA